MERGLSVRRPAATIPTIIIVNACLWGVAMIMSSRALSDTGTYQDIQGILVGMSSGAAMYAAAKVAEGMSEGVIVTIFPDTGERYLSTELF